MNKYNEVLNLLFKNLLFYWFIFFFFVVIDLCMLLVYIEYEFLLILDMLFEKFNIVLCILLF